MSVRFGVLLAALVLASPGHGERPKFGRLTWTEIARSGRWNGGAPPEMLISTKAFTPGAPNSPRDKDFGPVSGVWLKLERNNALQIPRLHATLDHLGMGLLSGTGPGVKLTPSQSAATKGNVAVEGKLYGYRLKTDSDKAELLNEVLYTPAGSGSFFFPTISRDGRKAYASKLTAGQDGIVYQLHAFDLTAATPTPVDAGRKGAYPAISPSGEYLAWVDRADTGENRLAVAKVADLNTITHQVIAPGDRRIVHPVWRGDSLALAFSSDYQQDVAKDNFDVYAVKLESIAGTGTQDLAAANAVKVSPGDGAAVWPAYSPDGKFVAYSYKPAAGGKYDVYVREVDRTDCTPKGDHEKVSDQTSADMDAMWVSFYQDLNPPCLRVELLPTDSGVANVMTLASFDESVGTATGAGGGGPLAGTAFFSAKGTHFARGMATPIANATSNPGSQPTTVPVPMTREPVAGGNHGIYLGLHVGKTIQYQNGTSTKVIGNTVTTGSMPNAGPYASIAGFYVNKDARVVVKISAKDNQWRRFYPGTANANAGETPWIFPEQDGRGMSPGYQPPYLQLMSRDKVLDGEPGVAWWWEDDQYNVLGGENTAEYVPRFGNFENDEEQARPKMVYFRAVANDLWRNRTELTIPVFVYTKELDLRVLNFDGAKKDGKPKGGR